MVAAEIFCLVVHSLRRLLSEFQSNPVVVLFSPRAEVGGYADSKKLEKEQYRLVTLFLFLEAKSLIEIKEHIYVLYLDSCAWMKHVKYWFDGFHHGHASVFAEQRPSVPKRDHAEDNQTKFHKHILAGHWLKVHRTAETLEVSNDSVGHVLHVILGIRKLSAGSVAPLLTTDYKHNCRTTLLQGLSLFRGYTKGILDSFVTIVETWIHCLTPENKGQWKERASPRNVRRKVRGCSISQKHDGHLFLNPQDVTYIWTTWKGVKRSQVCTMPIYWAGSCWIAKTAMFREERSVLPQLQRTSSYLQPHYGQMNLIGLWTAAASTAP